MIVLTKNLKRALVAAFEERTKKPFSEVGMMQVNIQEKPYTKQGIDYTGHTINVKYFDHRMSHITTITKPQFRRYLEKQETVTMTNKQ